MFCCARNLAKLEYFNAWCFQLHSLHLSQFVSCLLYFKMDTKNRNVIPAVPLCCFPKTPYIFSPTRHDLNSTCGLSNYCSVPQFSRLRRKGLTEISGVSVCRLKQDAASALSACWCECKQMRKCWSGYSKSRLPWKPFASWSPAISLQLFSFSCWLSWAELSRAELSSSCLKRWSVAVSQVY